MPLYEYACNHCGKVFILLQTIGTTESDTSCSYCGSSDVKRKVSMFSSSTSGGGFGSGSFPVGGT
ncbi:MAG TPA: zinc ribbon domain-containing protein [Thermodesulfovibrionia bacterium]|nr:zinc ribbon domain-containing protein [Thermodesulfovibrionia bacterium]